MFYHHNFIFSPFHGVFMLLFWILVIYGIVMLVKRSPTSAGKNTALDILKERYAKGEITKEQFEGMKKDLE